MEALLDDDAIVLRPTSVGVDLGALRDNVEAIRTRVGSVRIMATVKANAYGHGLIRTAQALLSFGVDALGVAFLEEGIALRRAGITAPVLVLGGIIGNQISHFLEYDLDITASSVFKLKQIEETAAAWGRTARVHVKIDTGMGRIGIRPENASSLFAAVLESPHCTLAGVYSHFAASHDTDPTFTHHQRTRFEECLEYFPRHGLPFPTRHLANSGAILQHPDSWYDMVRPGILLYGVYPSSSVQRTIAVRPVLSFSTRVVYFKVVRSGTPLGYDGTWTASRDTRIVTLPVGYGDGYFRALSNRGAVLIGGKRHPIVGRISMDQCMVDIGEDSAYNGDEVMLIGTQGGERITCEDIAEWVGTIPYEVLTNINTRVPRRYLPAPEPEGSSA